MHRDESALAAPVARRLCERELERDPAEVGGSQTRQVERDDDPAGVDDENRVRAVVEVLRARCEHAVRGRRKPDRAAGSLVRPQVNHGDTVPVAVRHPKAPVEVHAGYVLGAAVARIDRRGRRLEMIVVRPGRNERGIDRDVAVHAGLVRADTAIRTGPRV